MKHTFLLVLSVFLPVATCVANEFDSMSNNIPAEYLASCSGLFEKDSCQVHGKTNNLLSGSCRTKSVAGNVELVCVPDPTPTSVSPDSDANPNQDGHQHKHKHH